MTHCRGCPFKGCEGCAYQGETLGTQADSRDADVYDAGDLSGARETITRTCETPASTGIDRGRGQTSEESDMPSVPTEPTPTSVYLYFDELEVLIYVGVTSRGARRQREHNGDKDWWQFVTRQEVRHFPTRGEALAEERRLISKHLPPFNRVHNPAHEQALAAYRSLHAARTIALTTTERQAIRRSLALSVMTTPLPGHAFTLYSSVVDSNALVGEFVRDRSHSTTVSTPQRQNSGHIVDARYVGGMLLLGINGKFMPDEVTSARAMVSVVKNRKPEGFEIRRILLNEKRAA